MNAERWYKFSFAQQMGHIGSEIGRAKVWEQKNNNHLRNFSLVEAINLIDITKDDKKLKGRRKELCYLKELVANKLIDSQEYQVTLEELDQYCLEFALMAAN